MIVYQALALLAGIALWGPPRPAVASSAACDMLAQAKADTTADRGGWNGLYQLNRSQSDDLEKVADEAVGQLGRRAQRRAGGKLRERLKPQECLRLSEDSTGITIESERGVLWQVGRDGNAKTGGARAGGSRALAASVSDSVITLTGSGERGQGQYQLRRGAGGNRLELGVSLSPQRLERPIAYTLVYDAVDRQQPAD